MSHPIRHETEPGLTPVSRSLPVLAAVAVIAWAPGRADAQANGFLGVGAGAARVAEPAASAARLAPALNVRPGWRFNPRVAVMIEYSLTGIGSVPSDSAVIATQDVGGTDRGRPLQTEAVLVSVQLGTPALYVRPGAGWSHHRFPVTRPPLAGDPDPDASYRSGPAAAIALGRRIGALPGVPLAVEAVGIWTGGEDGTHPRWSAGVQVTSEIRI